MCPKLKYNIENLSLNISINTALFEMNLSELKLHWSHMSERVNPSWKQVTDDTSFPFSFLCLYPPLSLL